MATWHICTLSPSIHTYLVATIGASSLPDGAGLSSHLDAAGRGTTRANTRAKGETKVNKYRKWVIRRPPFRVYGADVTKETGTS
jgi:hypothetical protein